MVHDLELAPTDPAHIPGWGAEPFAPALAAFRRSCTRILALSGETVLGGAGSVFGRAADWRDVCGEALALAQGEDAARAFFEERFVPCRLRGGSAERGLFTGYYEPELFGAREPSARYSVPVHGRPADLVSVDLGLFRSELKGERVAGRVAGGALVPYAERAEIAGRPEAAPVVLWVDDPVALFFLQIQGSGRVELPDGSALRLVYDGQNGRPYRAIGKVLADRGALPRDAVSLQTIRAWLVGHPAEAEEVMNANPSYVFFALAPVEDPALGAKGAEGVPLTPGASLAVDARYIAYGVPVFVSGTAPSPAPHAAAPASDRPFTRLLVAQDTGGAIRGPIRGDVYWGVGAEAEDVAGRMKHEGEAFVLLPRALAGTR